MDLFTYNYRYDMFLFEKLKQFLINNKEKFEDVCLDISYDEFIYDDFFMIAVCRDRVKTHYMKDKTYFLDFLNQKNRESCNLIRHFEDIEDEDFKYHIIHNFFNKWYIFNII